MNNKNPKYDNEFVTLGYLKNTFQNSGESTTDLAKYIQKSYASPPTPPYYTGTILYYNHSVYRCKKDRLQGTFNWNDWVIVSTDDNELTKWVETTYSVDKLQLQEQIDGKIETYYQNNDPNNWATDLEKAKHVGDYWYNTTNDTQWRFCRLSTNPVTYAWQQVDVPNAIYDSIDSKKSIYTTKPTSYKKDDLWVIESTLSDSDLPVGTTDNPIAKGDWVFATQDSTTYNKAHWVKRDTNITKEYIEDHYYTTGQIDTIVEEIDRDTDAKIDLAKDEISLSVSQTYVTQTTYNQKVLDYDTEIGNITNTVTEHTDSISDLSVDVAGISNTVQTHYEQITDDLTEYKETIRTQFLQTNDDFTFRFDNISDLINQVSDTEGQHYSELHKYIRFVDGKVILGEEGNPFTAELDNQKLAFKQNGTEVAYISNNKLYITSSEISVDLKIGNFGFVPKSNGSLSFKKVV